MRSFLCLYVFLQSTHSNRLESECDRSCISNLLAVTYFLPQVEHDQRFSPLPWWTLLCVCQPEIEENDFRHGLQMYLCTREQCSNNSLWLWQENEHVVQQTGAATSSWVICICFWKPLLTWNSILQIWHSKDDRLSMRCSCSVVVLISGRSKNKQVMVKIYPYCILVHSQLNNYIIQLIITGGNYIPYLFFLYVSLGLNIVHLLN